MFTSLLNSTTGSLTISTALLCTGTSLILGFLISAVYHQDGHDSRSFMTSLVLLPILVQMVIMMVNGNLGTSVAVLGTFGLVRFRSAPGTSREICFIFLAMAVGLATGTGYLTFALFMTLVIGTVVILMNWSRFAERGSAEKELKITIPENLDYTEIFDDIFEKYLKKYSLERVKTTNLGSMIECKYRIVIKDINLEKKMIDELRCRNGNLTILIGRESSGEEL